MRICVTGGAGFLGSHVADVLADEGHDVVVLDKDATTRHASKVVDITSLDDTVEALRDLDGVCHLAAVGDVYLAAREPWTAAAFNAVGTANVVEAARRNGLQKLVYASTWEVYGEAEYQPLDERHPTNPDHPYSITKLAGERLVLAADHLQDVPSLALRLGTSYGTRMRPNAVFSIFIDKASRGEPITIQGSGSQGRQFVHVRDVGRAFAMALSSDVRGEVFNTVGDEDVTIRQLAEMVVSVLPTELQFGEARSGDVPSSRVSSEKAREMLGWQPQVPFQEGLEEIIAERTGAAAPV